MGHVRSLLILCHSVPQHVYKGSCDVRQNCYQQHELPKFGRAPCALQVFPPIQYRGPSNEQGHNVLFGKGGREINPRIKQRPLRNDSQEALVESPKDVAGDLVGDGYGEE